MLQFSSGQTSTAVVGVKFWKPQQWASLATDRPLRVCRLSLVFHEPSSTDFEGAVSFRWRSGISIGESHSKRRQEKETDPTWPDDLEIMLSRILRTYWTWIYGWKKQQSWSQKPVNDCHCLCGCDCYWSSSSSKSGNISQVLINIVSSRKTVVLFYAGSHQVELQGDTRGFPFESHPISAMYNPREIYTCEKFKIGSTSSLQLHLNFWSLWSISFGFLCP